MRDILVTLLILGTFPIILWRPWTGVLVSVWVSMFAPHKYAFGFANTAPFALMVAVVTVLGMVLRPDQVRIPRCGTFVIMVLLPLWMTVTTVFALEPEYALVRWKMVMAVFAFVFLAAALLHTRKQLEALMWVMIASVGFYGVKGGVFTIATAGANRVWGPPGDSFITDNNAIAIALIMIIPFMQYFAGATKFLAAKWALHGSMLLSALAVLGTHSRGALLGAVAMTAFLWLKGKNKLTSGIALMVIVPLVLAFMPSSWTDRMESIRNYEQDTSALGRLNAWHTAVNVANDRPIVGGGYDYYSSETFSKYAPNPEDVHSAHSIYFQMLGEHGYVGMALFVMLSIAAWRTARRIIRNADNCCDLAWASRMARTMQVSLVGFAAGGLFVNIGYWELPYYAVVILMATDRLVAASTAAPTATTGHKTSPHISSHRLLSSA